MTRTPLRVALPAALLLAAACSVGDAPPRGDASASTLTADSVSASALARTPSEARALRDSAQRVETATAGASPAAGPSAEQDSAQWAAEEAAKFAVRKRNMGSYASCMAQTRGLPPGASRDAVVGACNRLPDAPR
jgi:hypothetical protein